MARSKWTRTLVVAEVSFEIGELTQDMSWGGGVLGFLQQRQGLEEGLRAVSVLPVLYRTYAKR